MLKVTINENRQTKEVKYFDTISEMYNYLYKNDYLFVFSDDRDEEEEIDEILGEFASARDGQQAHDLINILDTDDTFKIEEVENSI